MQHDSHGHAASTTERPQPNYAKIARLCDENHISRETQAELIHWAERASKERTDQVRLPTVLWAYTDFERRALVIAHAAANELDAAGIVGLRRNVGGLGLCVVDVGAYLK